MYGFDLSRGASTNFLSLWAPMEFWSKTQTWLPQGSSQRADKHTRGGGWWIRTHTPRKITWTEIKATSGGKGEEDKRHRKRPPQRGKGMFFFALATIISWLLLHCAVRRRQVQSPFICVCSCMKAVSYWFCFYNSPIYFSEAHSGHLEKCPWH